MLRRILIGCLIVSTSAAYSKISGSGQATFKNITRVATSASLTPFG
jgi:hypothetical protein